MADSESSGNANEGQAGPGAQGTFDGSANAARARHFVDAFHGTAAAVPERIAVRSVDDAVSYTWGELRRRADALAGGLARLGVGHGDNVALMLSNRPEFVLADLGVLTAAATPFSIYQTLSSEQIEYVVGDARARLAIVERAFLETFHKAWQNLPDLEHVIVIDGDGEEGTLRLDEVEGSDPGFDVEASVARIEPNDLITLIYTSGTTGPPKGVQLSHQNLTSCVRMLHAIIDVPDAARFVSWLPAAHIAERAANYYIPVTYGGTIATCPDPREIVSALPRVKPHMFFAVPRIWEKVKAGLESRLADLPGEQGELARQALAGALEKVRLEQAGEPVPEELAERWARADEALFSKLRALLGLSEARSLSVGAAPTPRDVLEFFHAIGLEVGELWGMSETSGAGTANRPGSVRIGTVGTPLPGIEVKLADDGELLVRGPNVMVGYRNMPEKTAEALDAEGWLLTGDIAEIDADGYVRIVDRKKELIINAAGKNMSPANIESTIKGTSALVGQACVIGDARPYNTALLVLDADYAPAWAKRQGVDAASLEALASNDEVRKALQADIDRANAQLSRVEQIKKFTIVPGDWAPGGDELTPTMKLKRKPIAQKYQREIEAMYAS